MMEYKGYKGQITDVDEEHGILHGSLTGLTDVVTFEGKDAEELTTAFRESVDDYLEFCKERGEAPDKPFSGKFVVRVPPALHQSLALAAKRKGQSLNALIVDALQTCVQQPVSAAIPATVVPSRQEKSACVTPPAPQSARHRPVVASAAR